jgi:serine/threonine protein kinase
MIRHPNVVSIHDFSDAVSVEASKEAYLVMELVKGVSLRTILQSEGHLSPSRAVAIMQDICAGVGAAHRQGLLHRDLKPDNVIITAPADQGERETAKVVDFGLAKVYDEGVSPLTKAGVLVGTLIYMAPEQCRGEELDARADVYSLGAMLYEMLSGQPPFTANTLTGLITKHLNDVPTPFDRALHIPFHLEQSCLRALAKSPGERQSDAVVLGKELQAALDGVTDPLAQQPPIALTSAPARKSNLWKWIVAFVLVTALGVTLLAVGVAIKLWLDKSSTDDQSTSTTSVEQKTNSDPDNKTTSAATTKAEGLRGTWTGTYGVMNQPASLTITRHEGDAFEGVLEQKTVRVAFKGSIKSDKIHMTQTKVLQGEGWDLGEDSGTISADGNRISGTGTDSMTGVLGISYNWSFSRSNQ